ncbi:MAG: methylmalonyl-CoA mutase family protein [Planctomycetota bacterium]
MSNDAESPSGPTTEPSHGSVREWEAAVLESVGRTVAQLATATDCGISLQPLYLPSHGPSAVSDERVARPFAVDTPCWQGWRTVQSYGLQSYGLDESRSRIAEDVAGGVGSFIIELGESASLADLQRLFTGVDLSQIEIGVDAGPHFVAGAALLRALWSAAGTSVAHTPGGFRADPLGALAARGSMPFSPTTAFSQLAELITDSAAERPCGFDLVVSSRPYHEAGAHPIQELAAVLATAVEYLRELQQRQVDFATLGPRLLFALPVDADIVDGVAKLRALRFLWARVLELWGLPESDRALRLEVSTGRRSAARRDPWMNLVRGTITGIIGAIANVDRLMIAPFAEHDDDPALASRLARNTQHLLREESHLDAVVDPAGGSALFETRTHELAAAAWEQFQQIERQGGMLQALQSGQLARDIAETHAKRLERLRTRRQGIVGVSEFAQASLDANLRARTRAADRHPSLSASPSTPTRAAEPRTPLARATMRGDTLAQLTASQGASPNETTSLPESFPLRRWAEPFEALRDASDRYRAQHGHPPRVFLAALGSPQESTPRVNYLTDLLAAGGFTTLLSSPVTTAAEAVREFTASGARIAALGSSDPVYEQHAERVARELRDAGARRVILAGRPGAHEAQWRAAGIDAFVFVGADVCAELECLQRAAGVESTNRR